MLATILSTLIGVIVGGLLTWVVAKAYYEKAGQELRHKNEII